LEGWWCDLYPLSLTESVSHSAGMPRARARTSDVMREELEMMVLQFTCRDDSAFQKLGKHCKEMTWQVAALGTAAKEIKLHIEKLPSMAPQVALSCQGEKLFPISSEAQSTIKDHIVYTWPYRAMAHNVDQPNFWEIKLKGGNDYYRASELSQRKDGLFSAKVWLPEPDGKLKEGFLPLIDRTDIREAISKDPIVVPERKVVLDVPPENPLKESTLTVTDEGGETLITHFFARPTPPPPAGSLISLPQPIEIRFTVPKERDLVTANASIGVLAHYLSQEACSVRVRSEGKNKTTWEIQIGPFATHVICLERKFSNRILTLTVDGTILVESTASDFDCADDEEDGQEEHEQSDHGTWHCLFRFIGERSVKFQVHENTPDGKPLDSTDILEGLRPEQVPYSHVCTITVKDIKFLTGACLAVSGVKFEDLKQYTPNDESPLKVDPVLLERQHGLHVPYKCKQDIPSGLLAVTAALREGWEKNQPGFLEVQRKMQEQQALASQWLSEGWTSLCTKWNKTDEKGQVISL